MPFEWSGRRAAVTLALVNVGVLTCFLFASDPSGPVVAPIRSSRSSTAASWLSTPLSSVGTWLQDVFSEQSDADHGDPPLDANPFLAGSHDLTGSWSLTTASWANWGESTVFVEVRLSSVFRPSSS